LGFNISGWTSSYTGQPIPAQEMAEWVENTVARILPYRPQRPLEIGCGAGLLLSRIAPHCQEYWATDCSQAVLKQLERVLPINPDLRAVKLQQQQANDFTAIPAGIFDMVILNSVVQYFPSLDYLIQVVEGSLSALGDQGTLFVGDVRSLPLLEAYHAAVQLAQAEQDMTVAQWRRQVQRSLVKEEELVIDPRFFLALQQYYPRITQVEIQPKRGLYQNELTQFRYDVILKVGAEVQPVEVPWRYWGSKGLSLGELRRVLTIERPETLGIRQVLNGRVQQACQLRDWLTHSPEARTVAQLRRRLATAATDRLDPEELWTLAQECGYSVQWSWCQGSPDGAYDLAFVHRDSPIALAAVRFDIAQEHPPTPGIATAIIPSRAS
ncbi:MAG: class I SAM-dependent methyltransferase, partial [Pseudanabaenales cyanobacterium]|nr:class I SAM-dependent methyltransferase [Pseudanabaenales cyanobacterium]